MVEKILKLKLYDQWKTTIIQNELEIVLKADQSVLDSFNNNKSSTQENLAKRQIEELNCYFYNKFKSTYSVNKTKTLPVFQLTLLNKKKL